MTPNRTIEQTAHERSWRVPPRLRRSAAVHVDVELVKKTGKHMPVGDRQAFMVRLAEKALGEQAQANRTFSWLQNRHTREYFGHYFSVVDEIYSTLGGARRSSKRIQKLRCDAYFGGNHNFILEFDEFQHFSSARARTLQMLPGDLHLGYDKAHYLDLCNQHRERADAYRKTKKTADFCFAGGRTAQRAYFDAFRDILPILHGLRPTVRVSEFEVSSISRDTPEARRVLRRLLASKAQQAHARDPQSARA